MVIPHDYSKIKFKDIGWKARVINGTGSWISFSLLWTCVGINTYTPKHTQAEIPESVHSGPRGEGSGPQRCHGFSLCLFPLPLPFLSRLSVSLCTPPPCIYFTVMGVELRPSLPLRYSPQCLKLAISNWLQFLPQRPSSWNRGLNGHTCHAYSVSQNSMYYFLLKAGKMGGKSTNRCL